MVFLTLLNLLVYDVKSERMDNFLLIFILFELAAVMQLVLYLELVPENPFAKPRVELIIPPQSFPIKTLQEFRFNRSTLFLSHFLSSEIYYTYARDELADIRRRGKFRLHQNHAAIVSRKIRKSISNFINISNFQEFVSFQEFMEDYTGCLAHYFVNTQERLFNVEQRISNHIHNHLIHGNNDDFQNPNFQEWIRLGKYELSLIKWRNQSGGRFSRNVVQNLLRDPLYKLRFANAVLGIMRDDQVNAGITQPRYHIDNIAISASPFDLDIYLNIG
ncbi:putative secreted protein [Wickerhamomyces ciferrii]|uniref:Secreted protein n=1 Tax=Wickerhamomyces ciferrii (strain ATCC 14091 / BCRC 22168 / CBS 111 / JCM 3599 / NBRC 0793 / NRRL Y-1031 F-60-10) TaxID=1206466 RepID=K0KCX2_WICCF|nr:uncharacterized protein BN7_275 [Wickerhamomyces ciferrii]CCH40741.1 putative secreted protein [Wickerhamomyces ciferrii]